MTNIFRLYLLILLSQLCSAASEVTPFFGCEVPTQSLTNGFDVRLFSYPLSGSEFKTRSFYYSEYTSTGMIGSTQVYDTTPSISFTWTTQTTVEEWGLSFINFPYLAEFTMYFVPDVTGYYQFIFNSIDDGAMVFMGNGAFACCDNTDISGVQANAEILWAYKLNDSTPAATESANTYLEAGIYYPLRIVYINIYTLSALNFQINNPSGQSLDLEKHLFILPDSVDQNQCLTTTPPAPVSTITTTVPCPDCTGPVTFTTETVVTTGSTPVTFPEIIVSTPVSTAVSTPVSTITTTVPCPDCTGPVTFTTETVVTTGSTPVTFPEIIVGTPETQGEKSISTDVLTVEKTKTLTISNNENSELTSVGIDTKPSPISLSSDNSASTEAPVEYTGGSLGRQVNGVFKSIFVIACAVLFI
ncbi:hypothetical protein B5S32_g5118 [[Candida] boidinii]|nr:hypothetical protein B5S32_g5118 [[Candida] boidinii]